MLRANGCNRVGVRNGGLRAWMAAGGPVTEGPAGPVAREGDFTAEPRAGFFVDKAAVQALSDRLVGGGRDTPLVCAVRSSDFEGQQGDSRSGHIPGSISIPYGDLVDPDGRLNLAKAKDLPRLAGLSAGVRPVLYCGGGVNAARLALALDVAGHPDATVYDGSLNEWRADPSLPLAQTVA